MTNQIYRLIGDDDNQIEFSIYETQEIDKLEILVKTKHDQSEFDIDINEIESLINYLNKVRDFIA